jgi:hypothetical protein
MQRTANPVLIAAVSVSLVALGMLLFVLLVANPASAQIPGLPVKGLPLGGIGALGGGASPVKSILGQATDGALDKLSKPGAFNADSAIRIGLPGQASGLAKGGLGGVMKLAGQAGVGGDISQGLNDAAGQAASAAKPILRAAIDHMSAQDLVGIGTGGSNAATQYLKKSAGSEIQAQITPLVRAALGKVGVLGQTSKLAGLGLSEDSLISYVTGKTADGIFLYMGQEEGRIRQNPMGLLRH